MMSVTSSPPRPWGLWLSDTVAVVSFWTVAGGLNEFFIAGLEPSEVLRARLVAVPILILTGALYGAWRDLALRCVRFDTRGPGARVILDSVICLHFRLPVYCSILWIGGADAMELLRGALGASAIILVCGRPCGLWIDTLRRLTKVSP